MNFVAKIPKLEQITPVYAVISIMIYAWSFIFFLWRVPSWIYFSTIGEIAVIYAYMVVANLIESILVLLVPVVMCIVLPQKWFYDRFVTRGSSLVLLGLGYMMYFDDTLLNHILMPRLLLLRMLTVAAGILVLVFLIDKVGLIRSIVDGFASRAVIFLYILIPVSVISLVTVLIRNIF